MSGEWSKAKRRAVSDTITDALKAPGQARATKRHRCEVTADRLGDDVERYGHLMSGAERDELSRVRFILQEIAEGKRDDVSDFPAGGSR